MSRPGLDEPDLDVASLLTLLEQARAELAALGVTEFGVDRLRQVGRGVRDLP
ncbi:MAG: hypothetical protein ACRDQU_18130 [Pseudonocardiaceae bacterium]